MAVVFSEGFDSLPALGSSNPALARIYGAMGYYGWFTSGSNVSLPFPSSVDAPFGYGKFLRLGYLGTLGFMLPDKVTNFYYGGHFRNLPGDGTSRGGDLEIYDEIGALIATVYMRQYGRVQVTNPSGVNISSALGVFPEFIWSWLEIRVSPSIFEVRINTQTVLSLPAMSTSPVKFFKWSATGLPGCDVDNIVVNDSDWNGLVRCQWLPANGPGNQTEWTSFNGSMPNWQAASNTLVDDTQFVFNPSTEPGDYDLYDLAALINAPEIFAVTVKGAYRQNDATQQFIQNALRTAGVDYFGTVRPANTNYQFSKDVYPLDPGTGVGWTPAAVNSLQVGPKQKD